MKRKQKTKTVITKRILCNVLLLIAAFLLVVVNAELMNDSELHKKCGDYFFLLCLGMSLLTTAIICVVGYCVISDVDTVK